MSPAVAMVTASALMLLATDLSSAAAAADVISDHQVNNDAGVWLSKAA